MSDSGQSDHSNDLHPRSNRNAGEQQGALVTVDRSDTQDGQQSVEGNRATIAVTRLNDTSSILPSSSSMRLGNSTMDAALTDVPNSTARPTSILALLRCALCSAVLTAPTTLRCGHSVCAYHVTLSPPSSPSSDPSSHSLRRQESFSSSTDTSSQTSTTSAPLVPSCPVTSCSPSSSRTPRPFMEVASGTPPLSSRVAYYPPPLVPDARTSRTNKSKVIKVASPKQDISLIRILPIVTKATRARDEAIRACDPQPFGLDDPPSSDEGLSADEAPGPIKAPISSTPPRQPPLSPRPSSSTIVNIPRHTSPAVSNSSLVDKHSRSRSPPSPEIAQRHTSRKRQRIRTPSPTIPPLQLDSQEDVLQKLDAEFSKQLYSELLCEICFSLLLNPVTTPCQHTFCSKCLSRTLDHSLQCPLCRQDLPGYSYFYDHAVNKIIYSIITRAFPQVHAEREAAQAEEEKNARLDTPIFVCQIAFPGMPTLLHFFEPRYRLMLRRCLQTPTHSFGMIMTPRGPVGNEGNDYGTMLEIVSVQMLPDGRSMVETRGTHRFRILERGSLDGYLVGRIQRVDDYPADVETMLEKIGMASGSDMSSSTTTSPPSQGRLEPSNAELMQICRDFYEQLKSGAAPWVVQQLSNTYGTMPEDLSTFTFWMALLLPIDEREKAKLLPLRSSRLRLRLLVHWIENLNNSWWFGQGCVIS